MTQKLSTPLEQAVVGPHIRHANPHPQYLLRADAGTPVTLGNATPIAETVGQTASAGTAATASRSDHVHAMPGLATTSAAGFMSAADKAAVGNIAYAIISPLGGALLDIDTGELVFDVETYEQVLG